jgi:hypothetical protein
LSAVRASAGGTRTGLPVALSVNSSTTSVPPLKSIVQFK